MSLGTELLSFSGTSEAFTRPVPVPELPAFQGKLHVRKVSARELDAVAAKEDDGNSRARYAVIFAANQVGQRIWGDHQAEALGANPHLLFLIERINHNGRQHNGLTEESRALTEKNCGAEEASGSPDSSAAPAPPATGSTGNG